MLSLVARRLLLSIPVLALASVVVFFGVSAVGDPLDALRLTPNVSQDTIDNIVARKHLDQPLPTQYVHWLREAATDRFGTTARGRPIWPDLRRAIGHTLQLVLAAEALALAVGITLGAVSARRRGRLLDRVTTTVSFLGYSVPIFWLALVLQVLAVNFYEATGLRLVYTSGLSSPDPGSGVAFLADRIRHLALPVLALSSVGVALYSRYMRAAVLDVAGADHVRTARAKGLPERQVTRRHVVRNALVPVVTVAALNFGTTFGGAIVTESIFALDGLGVFFLSALGRRDVYAVMAFLMVTAVVVVAANLVADLLHAWLDPRVRDA